MIPSSPVNIKQITILFVLLFQVSFYEFDAQERTYLESGLTLTYNFNQMGY